MNEPVNFINSVATVISLRYYYKHPPHWSGTVLDTSSDAKRASSFFKHDIVRGDINPARISIQYLVSSSLHVVPRVILVSIPLLLCLFLFNGVSSSCNSSASRTYQKKSFLTLQTNRNHRRPHLWIGLNLGPLFMG